MKHLIVNMTSSPPAAAADDGNREGEQKRFWCMATLWMITCSSFVNEDESIRPPFRTRRVHQQPTTGEKTKGSKSVKQ
jgi:hypothetical protein